MLHLIRRQTLFVFRLRRSERKKAHQNGRFWLKVDACDIKVALQEFVKGKWDGAIDLGDGKLQEMRAMRV